MMEKPFNKCRLCLKLGEFCSIFEQDESIKLSEMVMAFANVKIYEGDGLSDRVCTSCIENLSTAYLFKLQCERINSLLKQTPGIQLDHPPTSGFNEFINKDFYMHVKNDSIEGENNENYVKDNNTIKSPENSSYESNDDTDSDVDSIKCVYCNQAHNNYGSHKCHVTCTIEHDSLQQSSSNETLVATDITPQPEAMLATQSPGPGPETFTNFVNIPCVLCDDNFNEYDAYSIHLNKCTENVKLHHFVCPVCHEIYTEKLAYMEHLKIIHFKSYDIKSSQESQLTDPGVDIVDSIGPRYIKTSRPTKVRRQIGWSVEDIYQEIDVIKVDEKQTPTSSPFKTFFSKLGNESFSKSSTPKKVSFRKLIENGKAKTANCIPFKKYIDNYRNKKSTKSYSPIERKMQVTGVVKASLSGVISDSDYNSPGGTSEESWKLKQNLICACDKKVFMLSESIHDRDRIVSMVNELGGVVAENTKMEMLATHFISMLPSDTFTGMMVCSLATGKWLLHVSFIYDSFRCKKFMNESLYEWMKHPKILEIDNTSVEVARAAAYWHMELQEHNAKFPFEGKQIVLVMKKKYRQYYQMIFKTLKAKPMTYDPRTPGSCCNADYCFVDMKVIEKVKLKFFASHNVPVFPYQYILVFLLNRGEVADDHKYLLNGNRRAESRDTVDILINTY